MIRINNKEVDLILQLEEFSKIDDVFSLLSLDIDCILIICPELYFQRFVQYVHNEHSEYVTFGLERQIENNNSFIKLDIPYKSKTFVFYFIITSTQTTSIPHPIDGIKEYNTGFKIINT